MDVHLGWEFVLGDRSGEQELKEFYANVNKNYPGRLRRLRSNIGISRSPEGVLGSARRTERPGRNPQRGATISTRIALRVGGRHVVFEQAILEAQSASGPWTQPEQRQRLLVRHLCHPRLQRHTDGVEVHPQHGIVSDRQHNFDELLVSVPTRKRLPRRIRNEAV